MSCKAIQWTPPAEFIGVPLAEGPLLRSSGPAFVAKTIIIFIRGHLFFQLHTLAVPGIVRSGWSSR